MIFDRCFEVIFDSFVFLGGSIFHKVLQAGRYYLDVIGDSVAGGSLNREGLRLGFLIGGTYDATEGDHAGTSILVNDDAAQAILSEDVIEGGFVIWVGIAVAA